MLPIHSPGTLRNRICTPAKQIDALFAKVSTRRNGGMRYYVGADMSTSEATTRNIRVDVFKPAIHHLVFGSMLRGIGRLIERQASAPPDSTVARTRPQRAEPQMGVKYYAA